jgi:hypothetical protein
MPAGILGVPTASAQGDRLRPKGRLRQQPAGDSTEENWSRAMRTKFPNMSGQKQVGPDRSDTGQGRGDAHHDWPQPMRDRRPFPTTGFEAKEKGYALQMPAQGKGTL